MFPTTITIHNMIDLQRVIAALNGDAAPAKTEAAIAKNSPSSRATPARTEPTASVAADGAQGKTADASAQSAGSAEAAPQASTAASDKPVTYADLQAAVLKLHKADATAAKPIAEGMGFANFKAMPEDKWAEALAKVQEALLSKGVV